MGMAMNFFPCLGNQPSLRITFIKKKKKKHAKVIGLLTKIFNTLNKTEPR